MEMLLLGVVDGGKSGCDMLFMLTAPDEDRESLNTAQLGATILGSSRVIFYQHILDLLNNLDPAKAELAYLDTDSLVWYVDGDDISDALLPESRKHFESVVAATVFGDPDGEKVPHSKLKLEGKYGQGLFRGMKSYYLMDEIGGDGKATVRARGVVRAVQAKMKPDHFRMTESGTETLNNYALKPTPAMDMTIAFQSRRNATCLNYKRYLLPVRMLHTTYAATALTHSSKSLFSEPRPHEAAAVRWTASGGTSSPTWRRAGCCRRRR